MLLYPVLLWNRRSTVCSRLDYYANNFEGFLIGGFNDAVDFARRKEIKVDDIPKSYYNQQEQARI
jgi:hypothetical protein